MRYTYFWVDFLTIIVPFIFSFHPRLQFHKTWKAFFPAVAIAGAIFIAWDIYYTHLGVWGFNETYLTGIKVFNLPIEEVLFFFCIPYACVFTFHCLSLFIKKQWTRKTQTYSTIALTLTLLLLAVLYYPKLYTFVTFTFLSALLIIAHWFLKVNWLTRFHMIYSILLLPFFIVNGILTGTGLDDPIVWYNDAENMGIRLLTIPVEDIFYGMALILLTLLCYMSFLFPADHADERRYSSVKIPRKSAPSAGKNHKSNIKSR